MHHFSAAILYGVMYEYEKQSIIVIIFVHKIIFTLFTLTSISWGRSSKHT